MATSVFLKRGLQYLTPALSTATRAAPVRTLQQRSASTQTFHTNKDDWLTYREKPASLSYFTGNFKYNDLLIELETLYKENRDWKGQVKETTGTDTMDTTLTLSPDFSLEENTKEETVTHAWKLRDKMSEMLGIPLKTAQWRKITNQLNVLASLPTPLPSAVQDTLNKYARFDANLQKAAEIKTLDDLGRAYAAGRRKESSARCWVVEGEGKILVNGIAVENYFKRPMDIEAVSLPLKVTENATNYNVWVLVNGGGNTGQAEAIKLGIGKALLIHNMEWKPLLRQAGCITRDPRVVERKKEGQRKARAKYTWVKR
ncbi:ribosomal protein S5 domain 2-type protein [Spinellus fusiger]|nr:ribosomal protein S5 domain 2-type protein [Spinellus fusiger]